MPRAVVVDDYPIMRELLREFLVRASFEVVGEAGTGRELLEGYAKWDPDVVVLDILLPDENGVELTKKLLALDPGAKVLIVSGLEADGKLTAQCMEAGAKGLLPKPFTSEELVRALRAL
jgi:two-component system, chemotaxis family, chemotaxis protein CheY